jgi:hypothetical protein
MHIFLYPTLLGSHCNAPSAISYYYYYTFPFYLHGSIHRMSCLCLWWQCSSKLLVALCCTMHGLILDLQSLFLFHWHTRYITSIYSHLCLSARCNNSPALTQSTVPQMPFVSFHVPVIAKFNLIVNYARHNECPALYKMSWQYNACPALSNIIYTYISFNLASKWHSTTYVWL